jgi:cob(I)alamin adenosyltransferase
VAAAAGWRPLAMGVPGHSGGTAPASHRLPRPPTLDGAIITLPTLPRRCYRRPGRMTVNLTRIYTRLGDDGETHLGDMSRVPKTHPRIEAYGVVDELNANIGLALTVEGLPERYGDWLRRIQNDLFDVGADLSVPPGGERERLRVAPEQVTWLEEACDEVNTELPALRSFVLPGGTRAAAQLHVCRTVCRRAERRALDVEDGNPEVVRYLNRLSDLLFILSRGANAGEEPLWEPGRYR